MAQVETTADERVMAILEEIPYEGIDAMTPMDEDRIRKALCEALPGTSDIALALDVARTLVGRGKPISELFGAYVAVTAAQEGYPYGRHDARR